MKHQKHRMLTDREHALIPHLYFDLGKSTLEIAEMFGQHRTSIWFWLKKHGYNCRNASERVRVSYRTGRRADWKGGKYIEHQGYKLLLIEPNDPFYCMTKGKSNYVLEHRYIMAHHLGRPLTPQEIVHHLNGIKTDNRLSNLAVVNSHNHPYHTFPKLLQARIRDLEAELSQSKLL